MAIFGVSKSTDTWKVKIPFETDFFTKVQLGHHAFLLSCILLSSSTTNNFVLKQLLRSAEKYLTIT